MNEETIVETTMDTVENVAENIADVPASKTLAKTIGVGVAAGAAGSVLILGADWAIGKIVDWRKARKKKKQSKELLNKEHDVVVMDVDEDDLIK